MFREYLSLTFKGVRHRPMRSWLTIVGIIIAVMLVVCIFSLSSGVKYAVSQQLQMLGSDMLIIFPGKDTNPFSGSMIAGQKFKETDLLKLEKISGIRFVAPFDVAVVNVEYKGRKETVMVHGSPWRKMKSIFEESQGMKLESGSWPTSDMENLVVLGNKTAKELFKRKIREGDEILINSKRFTVAGVLSLIGNQEDDNSAYISLSSLHRLTGKQGALTAFVKLEQGTNIDRAAKQVKFELGKQEVVRDFSVITAAKAEQIVGSILSMIEFVLIIIALASLLVGAVGIMNTMYTSVLERTRQIGVMKAVGASNDGILTLFLIESGLIGLIGGVLGIILGILGAWGIGLIANGFGIKNIFSFWELDFLGILVILIVTFFVGVLAGIFPARRAAKMEPAEALRYE